MDSELNRKILVFDGNCRVCIGLKNVLVRTGVIDNSSCIAYQNLDSSLKSGIDIEKFRNGVALLSGNSKEPTYGAISMALLFEGAFPSLKFIFRIRILFLVFTFFYKMIAFNRYVIFLPKRPAIECDCYPDHAVYFRLAYILFTWLSAAGLFGLAGYGMMCHYNTSHFEAGIISVVSVLSPFLFQLILFSILRKDQLYEYAGHLGTILFAGALIMLPASLFGLISGSCNEIVVLINLTISLILMLRMHYKRGKFILLSRGWQISIYDWIFLSALYNIYA
jgi:predicted DCC family thiol-disulfide oxidoreductase YuxK